MSVSEGETVSVERREIERLRNALQKIADLPTVWSNPNRRNPHARARRIAIAALRPEKPKKRTGGIWELMSPKQRAAALAYDGPIGSGSTKLPAIKRTP
jgi:hypothetical protein